MNSIRKNVRENRRGNQEGVIKKGQSRETGNIGYTRYKTKTKKAKNTSQYVLDTTIHKQIITHIRHDPYYKQLEVKTNRTKCWISLYANI